MLIVEAAGQKRSELIQLLESQKLPFEDLPTGLNNFYAAVEDDQVVGLIGMELYGSYGLLRSMVVHPEFRNRQIAENLVRQIEEKAASAGIVSMFLLTETAENYFSRKGYEKISREEVPADVKSSSEFSHVCPVSATVMKKHLKITTPEL